jgi:hypothetical protein
MVSLGKIDPPPPASITNSTPIHVTSSMAARIAFPDAIDSMAKIPDAKVPAAKVRRVIDDEDEDDEDSDDEIDLPPPTTTNVDSEVLVLDDEDEDEDEVDQDNDPIDDEDDLPPPASTTNSTPMHVTSGAATTPAAAIGSVATGPDPAVLESILALSRSGEWI